VAISEAANHGVTIVIAIAEVKAKIARVGGHPGPSALQNWR
jgi:hypothetical protein